jgi:hypothetical protein
MLGHNSRTEIYGKVKLEGKMGYDAAMARLELMRNSQLPDSALKRREI